MLTSFHLATLQIVDAAPTIKQGADKRGLRRRQAHGLAIRDDAKDEDGVPN